MKTVQPAVAFERRRELAEIRDVVRSASAGDGGSIYLLGRVGHGKSHLLRLAEETAFEYGLEVLTATADEFESAYPFSFCLRLLERRVLDLTVNERRALLDGPAAAAEPLLQGDIKWVMGDAAHEFSAVRGLFWVVARLARRHPVALFADDLHFADGPSLRVLAYLACRLTDMPVALVLAARTPDSHADPQASLLERLAMAPARVMHLRPLTETGVSAMLTALRPAVTHLARAREVWEATQGIPLLIDQVVAALDDTGAARATVADLARLGDPGLGRLIARRLADLHPEVGALINACAVLSDSSPKHPLATAARLAELEPEDAITAAERLANVGLLADSDHVGFLSPMSRTGVLRNLSAAARASLHTRAARLLQEQGAGDLMVAGHLAQGLPITQGWALEVLVRAARAMTARGEHAHALPLLSHAVQWSAPEHLLSGVVTELAIAQLASGESTNRAALEAAIADADEPERAGLAAHAAHVLTSCGRHDDACALLERWGDDSPATHAALTCACVLSSGAPSWRRAVLRRAAADGDRSVTAARALDEALNGSIEDGHRLALTALAKDASAGLVPAIAALVCAGATTDALMHARAAGNAHAEALALLASGWPTRAEESARRVLDDAAPGGWTGAVPGPRAILGAALLDLGAYDAAAELVSGQDAWSLYLSGRVHLAAGEPKRALADLRAAGAALARLGRVPSTLVPWRTWAALAATGTEAVELAGADVAAARAGGSPAALGAALRALASAAGDPALLPESITLLRGAANPLELGRALLDQGMALVTARRMKDARPALREALDMAHHAGARDVEQRARNTLVAAGGRPRRTALHGPEALTPSERRIAELAVAGYGNPAIADQLVLTRNTVQWHLQRIYRKLGISSRQELTALLREVDGGT